MNRTSATPGGKLVATWVLATLVSLPALAEQPAGKVVSTSGEVQVVSADGQSRVAARNDVVAAGDTLSTGNGRAQLQFADGGLVALRPGTQFRIDEYNYGGQEDGTERSWFSLLKGGFRAISGSIGHRNPESYRVKTLVATIGIRGTVYDGEFCESSCGGKPKGLHVSTVEGKVNVTNAAGSLDVPAGQSSYVPDANTPPALVENEQPADLGDGNLGDDPYKAGENIDPGSIVPQSPGAPTETPSSPPVNESPGASTF